MNQMATYASARVAWDKKGRRIRTKQWRVWAVAQEPTGTTGKVKIDPEDGTSWEWLTATRQLTWIRLHRL